MRILADTENTKLARKRARDREAQRNRRQRLNEHIAYLEKRIIELDRSTQSSAMKQILNHNEQLEKEVQRLRMHVSAAKMSTNHGIFPTTSANIHSQLRADSSHRWFSIDIPRQNYMKNDYVLAKMPISIPAAFSGSSNSPVAA